MTLVMGSLYGLVAFVLSTSLFHHIICITRVYPTAVVHHIPLISLAHTDPL